MPSCLSIFDNKPGPISFFRSLIVVFLAPYFKVLWLPLPCDLTSSTCVFFLFARFFIFLKSSLPAFHKTTNVHLCTLVKFVLRELCELQQKRSEKISPSGLRRDKATLFLMRYLRWSEFNSGILFTRSGFLEVVQPTCFHWY